MIDGNLKTMMKIVHAYFDAGFNVCNLTQMVCALNYNGCGYSCIEEVIKHDQINLNELISEHYVDIKFLKNLYEHTNKFKLTSDHNSIKFWYYYGTYVPGVFSYAKNYATEENGERKIVT